MKKANLSSKKAMRKLVKVLHLMLVALILTACVGVSASAAEVSPTLATASGAGPGVTVESTSALSLPGAMLLTSNTGITEVDAMFDNLIDFISGVVKVVGVVAVLFGVVQLGLSIANHDPSQRAQGFLFIAGGVIVFFAPKIIALLQTP